MYRKRRLFFAVALSGVIPIKKYVLARFEEQVETSDGDVGVRAQHPFARRGECGRQAYGYRRFPGAALAGAHYILFSHRKYPFLQPSSEP